MFRWIAVLLFLIPLMGCEATSTGALRDDDVRSDRGFVTFVPSAGRRPVGLSDEDFRAFMRELGLRVTPDDFKALMQELDVHLRATSPHPSSRVVFVSWEPDSRDGLDQGVRDYLRWCLPLDRCIALPGDGRTLGREARRAIALDIALHSIWPGVTDAVGDMLSVRQLQAMVVASLVVYLALLVAPEPVTKVIAAKMTYLLLSYLGVSTLWHLVDAWMQLGIRLDAARTFDEVYSAGQRFGDQIGAQVARVLVTLATWALAHGLDGTTPTATLGGRLRGATPGAAAVPGATQAARLLGTEARGITTVPPVQAIEAVTLGEGHVTFAFSSGAAAVAEQATLRKEKETRQQPGPQQRPSGNAGKRTPVVVPEDKDETKSGGNWHHIATTRTTRAKCVAVRGHRRSIRFSRGQGSI